MAGAEIRVMLVDDHAIVRSGFRRLLEQTPGIVVAAEAASGEDAYQAFPGCLPDVTVMDLSMPGAGGLETIRRILARHPDARILVYSMHESAAFATQAMRAGACGYVTKASAPDVLVEAVKAATGGRAYLSPDMAQKIALDSVSGDRDPVQLLSTREFEVFRLLAEGRSTDDIAEALFLSHKTVANYATQVKQKLGVSTPVELFRLALKHRIVSE
ncbi:MAG TPA: response regulator transcription factor [Burkholderiales bacterium]|nr:response regulator transcription factor [Burkholderiales bacterium]